MKKYHDIKARKTTWNEKLRRKGIPSWEQMLAELKTI